jgi:hypothetical protein
MDHKPNKHWSADYGKSFPAEAARTPGKKKKKKSRPKFTGKSIEELQAHIKKWNLT